MDASTPKKGRREDFRLVSGQGKYTADWNLEGQAHGWFLRSDHAHAEIVSIDTSAALAVPGVLAVLTGADVVKAAFKTPPAIMFMKGKGGSSFKLPHRYALAHERVRFVGEPVALVVAENEAAAQDGTERIVVDYRDLPAVVDAQAALAPGAPVLHTDVPGNLAMEYEYGALAPVEAAFANAAHVARVTLDAQRIAGNPMEPKACVASFNPRTGVYDIYLPTQGMADVRGGFAHVAGVAADKVRIHADDVGGGFGVRNEVYPEFAALFLATQLLGRPVKWVGTRAESILSDHHGRGAKLTGALALDADGNFLGIRIEWLVNMGAYASNAGPFINTGAAPTSTAINAYRIPAAYGSHQLVFTNTTPTTAYRGAGRPNVAYLAERLVDEAARITGIDRIALRRKNLIPKTAFPYKTSDRLDLRQRRSARSLEAGVGGSRLEGLRASAPRCKTTRQIAGHRLRGLHRAVRRRRPGGDRNSLRRQWLARPFHVVGRVRPGSRDRLSRACRGYSGRCVREGHAARQRPGWPAARRHWQLRLPLADESRRRARNRGARDHPQRH